MLLFFFGELVKFTSLPDSQNEKQVYTAEKCGHIQFDYLKEINFCGGYFSQD